MKYPIFITSNFTLEELRVVIYNDPFFQFGAQYYVTWSDKNKVLSIIGPKQYCFPFKALNKDDDTIIDLYNKIYKSVNGSDKYLKKLFGKTYGETITKNFIYISITKYPRYIE
jgi:hypothetical protein